MSGLSKNFLLVLLPLVFLLILPSVLADTFFVDLDLHTSKTVYSTSERIEVWGGVFITNYSNGTYVEGSNQTPANNKKVTVRIFNKDTGANSSTTTLNVTNGFFCSRNDYAGTTEISGCATQPLVSAPSTVGTYYIKANYTDMNGTTWDTQNEIEVSDRTVDWLVVSTDKLTYSAGEQIIITAEGYVTILESIGFVAGVSINGTVRDSTKTVLSRFNCTTGSTGTCTTTTTAPTTYGSYYIEVNGFKGFSSFYVRQFETTIAMKDELGKSVKHIFNQGDSASVEVGVLTNSTSETYTFTGIIIDQSGTLYKRINETTLNAANSYINRFTFPLDSLIFPSGEYYVNVNVTKTGDGTISTSTAFSIQSWSFTTIKRDIGSGFEYEYTAFPGANVKFDIYPTWRQNGSIIPTFNVTKDFNITLRDTLNNIMLSTNASWNATCGKEGCYQINFTAPATVGEYNLFVTLSRSDDAQTDMKRIGVATMTMTAQSTDKDGTLKELFGTNEFLYITVGAKNGTTGATNLSNVTLGSVYFMNGSTLSYTQVANDALVNSTNNDREWSWNATTQRIKLDSPKTGGVYTLNLLGEGGTVTTSTRFIVNPYDVCIAAKNSPTTSSMAAGFYYVYQFKTTDTVYFEMKITQANNPTGRAAFSNATNSSYGMGSACADMSSTRQVVDNATITIREVLNTMTGEKAALNATSSTCQSDSSKGAYTCTLQPHSSWDPGQYGVTLIITGNDGQTSDYAYGNFEARAFYLYAYPSTWANTPTSNVQLNVNMYEAGNNWWSNYGSGGMSGTVTLEKIEYQGRDGEWIWPPSQYSYNVSKVNKTTITTGQGTMTISVNNTDTGAWKSGSYRAVLKGVNSEGVKDYGYAWFSIRQWEVYASPVDCSTGTCTSTWNVNSRNNISLYVTINNAGQWGQSGNSLGGPVIIRVKKLQDCRKWPCTDLNSSNYNSTSINVSTSSGWYWGTYNSSYIINLIPTSGRWGTGYYSAVLDVNGSETGTGWFNTIAFYIETQSTNENGTTYKYNVRNADPAYVKTTSVRTQKNGYYYGSYNTSDYINTTIQSAVLRTWDQSTYTSKEYNYPTDFNINITGGGTTINGTRILNITRNNGSWNSGYYWGELTLKSTEDNDTSTGWLNFQVQPFRVQITTASYNIDDDACMNSTLYIYDPDWNYNNVINGTYNVTSVTENVWSGYSNTITTYTNYTPAGTFNGSTTLSICPNNGKWTGGSWGNYHYLTVKVRDSQGNTQDGWVSFQAKPFAITIGAVQGGTNVGRNNSVSFNATVQRSNGGSATAYITGIYQWRYDNSNYNYYGTREDYNFTTSNGTCPTGRKCLITGTSTITVTAPSGGWQNGYNYLQTEWVTTDNLTPMNAEGSVWFNGRDSYYGWFNNYDNNGNWKYNFGLGDNITIQIQVRDSADASATVNITSVEYSTPSNNCWYDGCRTYNNATNFAISGQSNSNRQITGSGTIIIPVPSGNWSKGNVYIRATVRGSAGTATIKDGYVYIKDLTPPTINITSPTNGQNITTSTFNLSITTSESATCWLSMQNHQNYNSWYCGSSYYNLSGQSCNTTIFNGTEYSYEYTYKDYKSWYKNNTWGWSNGATGLSTGGTTHTYTYPISNLPTQSYGLLVGCNDEDWNYAYAGVAIRVNRTAAGLSEITAEKQLANKVEEFARGESK